MMATGHKLFLVRLVSSDCVELGLRLSTLSSELDIELGLPPSLTSAFICQLVADLPSHEVASISVPATASVVVEMLNGKQGEEEEALRLLLGIHLKQREEEPAEEEQLSIFYNYSADELVGNDEDTTVTFEPADIVGFCGLDWSAEVPHKVADDLEVEKVPDPDSLDPLNLMGETIVAPPIALQTSLIQASPIQHSPAQNSPLSSSPLQNSHILNTPVQGNTIQHEEQ